MKYLITILLVINFLFAFSQEEDKFDKFNSMKIAFITEKLNLSSEEAQKFWPVYNEYDKARKELTKEQHTLIKQCKNQDIEYSEKEYEKMSDDYVKMQYDEAKLLTEYHQKFKKVLPAKKVMKLYQAENQFRNHLLKQLRGGPGGGKGQHHKRMY